MPDYFTSNRQKTRESAVITHLLLYFHPSILQMKVQMILQMETTDDNNGGGEIPPVESPVETYVKCLDDNLPSSVVSSGKCLDETQISPIIDNINIKQEESLAHTHESTPPEKPKRSRKKEGDAKPLVYPFTSIAFMSAWTELVKTPKWKGKLNYALQISLNKLGKFEEEFAIRQIERAIES